MDRGGLMREILDLLDHHGLHEESKRLRAAHRDPETILDVVLGAYRKTYDGTIFSFFVRLTWPLLVSRARRLLKGHALERRAEKAVMNAYSFILRETLSPRTFAPVRNWKAALDALDREVLDWQLEETTKMTFPPRGTRDTGLSKKSFETAEDDV